MTRKKLHNLLLLSVALIPGLWGRTSALEVLTPGYVAETYVSYTCPAEGEPRGITFDYYGNLYLSNWDHYPHVGSIYRVARDRSVSRWVDGIGTPRVMVWGGGTDYGEYLYVTDATPCDLLKISLEGTVSTVCHISAGPHSLGLDGTGAYGGYMYVATRNPDQVYYVSERGDIHLFADFPGPVSGGHVDLAFDPGTDYGGLMYVALEYGNGHAGSYGLFTIDQQGNAAKFAPALVTACDVEIDPYGFFGGWMFVTGIRDVNEPYYNMWRADPDGDVDEFALGTIGTNQLLTFTFGPDGAMYVPEYSPEDQKVIVTRIVPR